MKDVTSRFSEEVLGFAAQFPEGLRPFVLATTRFYQLGRISEINEDEQKRFSSEKTVTNPQTGKQIQYRNIMGVLEDIRFVDYGEEVVLSPSSFLRCYELIDAWGGTAVGYLSFRDHEDAANCNSAGYMKTIRQSGGNSLEMFFGLPLIALPQKLASQELVLELAYVGERTVNFSYDPLAEYSKGEDKGLET